MTVMVVAMKRTSQVEAPNIHSDSEESPEDAQVETRDGRQYPGTERKPRFNDAMVPFFYLRPFLGARMGVLAYAGLIAGLLFTTGSTGSASAVRPESVLFAAVVAGLFAKTLIEKPKDSFDQIVGK
jgi:hypothetical protein